MTPLTVFDVFVSARCQCLCVCVKTVRELTIGNNNVILLLRVSVCACESYVCVWVCCARDPTKSSGLRVDFFFFYLASLTSSTCRGSKFFFSFSPVNAYSKRTHTRQRYYALEFFVLNLQFYVVITSRTIHRTRRNEWCNEDGKSAVGYQ